ncbi:hypothetical protein B0H16DRAFT_1321779, partial [Mycena metata]
RLRALWRSPVYSLYKDKVTIGYEGDRKYHLFTCANKKCHLGKHGLPSTVRRYLDSKDHSATGNLINHAKACRGADAVQSVMGGNNKKIKGMSHLNTLFTYEFKNAQGTRDGSIYAAFARIGSRVRSFSSRPHTSQETRANIVRWVTESNRPVKIVTDFGFETLMKTGRPSTSIPSPRQVFRDVHASFDLCKAKIAKLLQEYPGQLNFSTDAWTSPNHRAIVAWVVHLEHDGKPLSFLLDVKELPEVRVYISLLRCLLMCIPPVSYG